MSVSKTWECSWTRHEDSPFEARIIGQHEGPIDFTTGRYSVEVAHDSGRMYYLSVEAVAGDGPVIVANLVDNDETFLDPRLIHSLTKAMSLSTMPIVRWDGHVDD